MSVCVCVGGGGRRCDHVLKAKFDILKSINIYFHKMIGFKEQKACCFNDHSISCPQLFFKSHMPVV